MPCLAANCLARPGSRAATAAIATSGTWRDGLIRAVGVIRAAPSAPIRSRSTIALPILCRQSCAGNPVPSLDERPYSARGSGGGGAAARHLVQRDAGRHAGVERLGRRRDRNPGQQVATLGDEPGQTAPPP